MDIEPGSFGLDRRMDDDNGRSVARVRVMAGRDTMTTMLYNDPHPVHKRIATRLGWKLEPAEKGGPHRRVLSAVSRRPIEEVVLEGGAPLFEGSLLKRFHKCGRLIMMSADETFHNIVDPLPYYWPHEKFLHKLSSKQLDGVVAVSDLTAEYARSVVDCPVIVCEPFLLSDVQEHLLRLPIDVSGSEILFVGEDRPANNVDAVVGATSDAQLVGRGTEDRSGHGFVSPLTLIERYESADLFVFPALAGAHPMSPIEALASGTPAIVSSKTGVASVVGRIHEQYVVEPTADDLSDSIDWYFDLPVKVREEHAIRGRKISKSYSEDYGIVRWYTAMQAFEVNDL